MNYPLAMLVIVLCVLMTQSASQSTSKPTTRRARTGASPVPTTTKTPVSTTTPSTPGTTSTTTDGTTSSTTTEQTTTTLPPEPVSTTEVGTTTTMSTTTQSTPESTTSRPHHDQQQHNVDYSLYCNCDLTVNECDLNCCCDADCGQEERRLFAHCWTPGVSHFTRRYCSPSSHLLGVAWNNTRHEVTSSPHQAGLFCIVTDNVPKRRLYEEKPPASSEELFQTILPRVSGRWIQPYGRDLMDWIYQPFYREGSPIFTLHRSGSFGLLSKYAHASSLSNLSSYPVTV